MNITVVYATPDAQPILMLSLPTGATVLTALALPKVRDALGDAVCDSARVGVFSKLVTRDTVLHDGDRLELYRPLTADPQTARRKKANKKAKHKAGVGASNISAT